MAGLAAETGIQGTFTGIAGADLEPDRLVKKSGASWIYNGAGEVPQGVTADRVASGKPIAIRPVQGGLRKVTAAGVIADGATIYAAANGKVATTVSGDPVGVADGAATADGGKISAVLN